MHFPSMKSGLVWLAQFSGKIVYDRIEDVWPNG